MIFTHRAAKKPLKEIDIDATVDLVAQKIVEADAILFTSGAGLGVDSGLPDFRGPQGFWKAYPPMKELGLKFQQMSNPRWFNEDPELAWGFWSHRVKLYTTTKPHDGFDIMKSWGDIKNGNYFVYTSNVDTAFYKKDFPEEKILECHGGIRYFQCMDVTCCTKHEGDRLWPNKDFDIPDHDENFRATGDLPTCKHCGGIARPNVLMFEDTSFLWDVLSEQEAAYDKWAEGLVDKKLVIIEIGAGTTVPTIRYHGESLCADYPDEHFMVRINPSDYETPVGADDFIVPLPLGGLAALQRIDERIKAILN